jgi:exodeoxyribonuclease VII small subunit
VSYEKSIKELEDIVTKLGDENLGIEESIALYARGIELAKEGLGELGKFKSKIELFNKDLSKLEAEMDNGDAPDDDNAYKSGDTDDGDGI